MDFVNWKDMWGFQGAIVSMIMKKYCTEYLNQGHASYLGRLSWPRRSRREPSRLRRIPCGMTLKHSVASPIVRNNAPAVHWDRFHAPARDVDFAYPSSLLCYRSITFWELEVSFYCAVYSVTLMYMLRCPSLSFEICGGRQLPLSVAVR